MVKEYLFYLVFIFCILFHGSAIAITVDELQKKMRESELILQSMKFDFIQETRSALSSEKRESSGVAYIRKPKQLRIEQNEPEKQLVVTNGKTVYIYTPRFNQVIKDSWNRWFSKNIFFPGMTGFSEMFEILKKNYQWEINGTTVLNGENTVAVQLKRTGSDRNESLKMWISENDFIPRKTEFTSGTLTLTTTLVSLKLNEELKQDLFKFSRPEKSEVIQMP